MIKAPRGTQDIMPGISVKWRYIESVAIKTAENYGYSEIKTPIFEDTSLFSRSVGEYTDIVEKEMYTFIDKGERSITLRPEGTSAVARAYIEHNIDNSLTWKIFYTGPFFRYERPQSGRYRQHYQFGAEAIGSSSYLVDFEVIKMAFDLFEKLGLKNLIVRINSICCEKCRPDYLNELKEYFKGNICSMCDNCNRRLEKNTLRILDCKNPACRQIIDSSPKNSDNICSDCRDHHEGLKNLLNEFNVKFQEDHLLVRGLDYYTKTVFEVVSSSLGSQNTVCGGGRYDKLIKQLGSKDIPAVGFALGMERIALILEKENPGFFTENKNRILIIGFEEIDQMHKINLLYKLRSMDIIADLDYNSRSFKSQMKLADRMGYDFAVIIGEDEVKNNYYTLKDLKTGVQQKVSENELIIITGGEKTK